jgi:hypothetical protein
MREIRRKISSLMVSHYLQQWFPEGRLPSPWGWWKDMGVMTILAKIIHWDLQHWK